MDEIEIDEPHDYLTSFKDGLAKGAGVAIATLGVSAVAAFVTKVMEKRRNKVEETADTQ